jgi:hypothetical protein
MPPATYAPVHAPQGGISPLATGLAGAIPGGLAGAGYVASKKLTVVPEPPADSQPPKSAA